MYDRFAAAEILRGLANDRQQSRLLRLSFPRKDGPKALILVNALKADEGMSRDFHYAVEVLSDDPRIELKDVQGRMVTIELVREDGSLRYFNGYVFEFRLVSTDSGYAFYDMVLLPWMAYLRLRHDNYLFHRKSLYDQTLDILGDYAEVADWKTRVTGPDEATTVDCMFDETDYNYLHRKWEAKGWHYWYEHRKDGHTLVLGDDTLRADPIDGGAAVPWQDTAGALEDDGISKLTSVRRIVPASVALTSFDFKSPRPVTVDVPTINQQGKVLKLEAYEYAGAYGFKDHHDGERLVRQRMEEIEAGGKHFEASGNDRTLQPGRGFKLTGHFETRTRTSDPDLEFLILSVTHEVSNNYLQRGDPAVYSNTLVCIRKRIPWRPGRAFNSTEPKIYGLQTATVAGPTGEEIFTDDLGRVLAKYHWDRQPGSSAWIRVASPWAGGGYGFIGIPRIGQEVVVQFQDGNPDRPLITHCVYNAWRRPPWALPAASHQTGIRTLSTPGGAGHCELVIHDRAGHELINIFSQKDMVTTVLNDESTTVHHKQSLTIDSDQTTQVHGAKRTIAVTHGAQETTVKQQIKIESSSSDIHVKAATTITFEVGASKIVMSQDGSITIQGTKVKVIGTDTVEINE